MKEIKQYAIVSKDRHRDDNVYIFNGTLQQVIDKCEEVWNKDFSFPYDYKWCAGGGSYEVDYCEVKLLE